MPKQKWHTDFGRATAFVENKGQFIPGKNKGNNKIQYELNNYGTRVFFEPSGLTYLITMPDSKQKASDIKRKMRNVSEDEDHIKNMVSVTEEITMTWINANPDVKIVAENKVAGSYNYFIPETNSTIISNGFKKIIYKNLYPGIDVEYSIHEKNGIKYSLILHPGADINAVKIQFTGQKNIRIEENGTIRITAIAGDIVDSAPITFYNDDQTIIPSSFNLDGNIINFKTAEYDRSRTITIDPWTTTPILPGSNKAYDVERDNAGNIYVYGGNAPYTLLKYNSSGTLIWSFTSANNNFFYGDLVVEPGGNATITDMINIQKVSPGGVSVWTNTTGNGNLVWEYWTITYNNIHSKLKIFGGSGTCKGMDVNLLNGAINSTTSHAQNEIRSTASAANGNYYCLTHGTKDFFSGTYTAGKLIALDPNLAIIYSVSSSYKLTYDKLGYAPLGYGAINGIAVNKCAIYTSDGATLFKRDIGTGSPLDSVVIPNGRSEFNSGIAVDSCGNVFVGSGKKVHKYDRNLNLITSAAVSDTVYGLCIGKNSEIIACGKGFLSSIDMQAACLITAREDTVLCSGGSVVLNVTGGSNYSWQPSAGLSCTNCTAPVATPTVTTKYIVTMNALCGSLSDTVLVTVNSCGVLSANISQINVPCGGDNNGSATVVVTNGTPSYTYSWSTGASTTTNAPSNTLNNLTAGTYTVTIKDASGTSTTATFTLSPLPAINSPIITITNSSCGNSNGNAVVTASGGSGLLTYNWSNGTVGQTASGLSAGSYSVTVTDENGCTNTASADVLSPPPLSVQYAKGSSNCTGCSCKEWIMINAIGGTSPYSYLWPDGYVNRYKSQLCPGNYTINIKDKNGCSINVNLTAP
ncbi:MAG: hypothetical protein HYU69_01700 [Bacteroidetes bacterium]|nr:hypothetical protein [Bacteroidota bacterium]